ncbi:MAG: DNA polymerase, partial [Candidatus Aenigmarchaeota archaeon]|nr:DNA polymerase [Candidatus Aenigmarchaeota archaeon]
TVKRDLNKYRQIGPHVSAAKRAEKRGVTIHPGTTIQYVVTRGSGSISERAELMQFAKNYDKAYYLENQILPAALRALSVLGVTKDDLLGNAKQTGLGKWGNAT